MELIPHLRGHIENQAMKFRAAHKIYLQRIEFHSINWFTTEVRWHVWNANPIDMFELDSFLPSNCTLIAFLANFVPTSEIYLHNIPLKSTNFNPTRKWERRNNQSPQPAYNKTFKDDLYKTAPAGTPTQYSSNQLNYSWCYQRDQRTDRPSSKCMIVKEREVFELGVDKTFTFRKNIKQNNSRRNDGAAVM